MLTTSEISAISFAKFDQDHRTELRVGNNNHGLFQHSLTDGNNEWRNFTTENPEMPSNKVNRIVDQWTMTDNGAAYYRSVQEEWAFRNTEDGLLDNNTFDINGLGGYGGGAALIATEKGVVIGYASSDEIRFSRLSGGMRCHFEHVSRFFYLSGIAWLLVDQKDETAPNGWRAAAICQGKSELFSISWDHILLDGVAPVDARITTHYQDQDFRIWIAFSPTIDSSQADNSQATLANYDQRKGGWTSYQLPADFPAIAEDAVMLMVGNDLWVGNSGQAAFIVLEDVVAE